MTTQEQFFATAPRAAGKPAGLLSSCIRSMGVEIATWAATCADYYAAAAMYEQLSTISDAELMRRGFSRATLARAVCAACDRFSEQDWQGVRDGPSHRVRGRI